MLNFWKFRCSNHQIIFFQIPKHFIELYFVLEITTQMIPKIQRVELITILLVILYDQPKMNPGIGTWYRPLSLSVPRPTLNYYIFNTIFTGIFNEIGKHKCILHLIFEPLRGYHPYKLAKSVPDAN